eukprot:gnl/Hemi2/476_TR167_c0_g1_i1.p1 gnl/Hemi2/476_TR167_c0_g1~~gnl/Hemi2/476_TR167_c0_g1_i1.p1  ORF type:complete len:517 (+),score=80.59 gnl/Hemi2/476_TR167_c0_g1_i1:95-1645(+)
MLPRTLHRKKLILEVAVYFFVAVVVVLAGVPSLVAGANSDSTKHGQVSFAPQPAPHVPLPARFRHDLHELFPHPTTPPVAPPLDSLKAGAGQVASQLQVLRSYGSPAMAPGADGSTSLPPPDPTDPRFCVNCTKPAVAVDATYVAPPPVVLAIPSQTVVQSNPGDPVCIPNACLNNCTCHGTCDATSLTCTCGRGWTGDDCSIQMPDFLGCPNNCSSHGLCDEESRACLCMYPFSGDDCGYATCNNDCNNHGTCDHRTGLCVCDADYFGDDCLDHLCGTRCSGHGVCNKHTGTCLCDPGWYGSDCVNPMTADSDVFRCPANCNNNGVCDSDSQVCQCIPPYFGYKCEGVCHVPAVTFCYMIDYLVPQYIDDQKADARAAAAYKTVESAPNFAVSNSTCVYGARMVACAAEFPKCGASKALKPCKQWCNLYAPLCGFACGSLFVDQSWDRNAQECFGMPDPFYIPNRMVGMAPRELIPPQLPDVAVISGTNVIVTQAATGATLGSSQTVAPLPDTGR